MSSILFSFMYWGVQQMNLKHLFYLLILLTSIIKRVEQLRASQIEHTSEHLTAPVYPGFKASQYNIHWHESWRKDVMGSLSLTLWEGMYCKTLTPLASNRLSIDMQIREELVCGLLIQSLNISSEKKNSKTAPLIFLPTDAQKPKWMRFHSAALKANEAIAEKLCIGPESWKILIQISNSKCWGRLISRSGLTHGGRVKKNQFLHS